MLDSASSTGSLPRVSGTRADRSDRPFQIVAPGNAYYVNDAGLTRDVFTTAPGNNANTGRAPDRPLLACCSSAAANAPEPTMGRMALTGQQSLARTDQSGLVLPGLDGEGPRRTGVGALRDVQIVDQWWPWLVGWVDGLPLSAGAAGWLGWACGVSDSDSELDGCGLGLHTSD